MRVLFTCFISTAFASLRSPARYEALTQMGIPASNPDVLSISEQVFRIVGDHALDAEIISMGFLLYHSTVEDFFIYNFTLFSDEAIVELNWDRRFIREIGDVTLTSLTCSNSGLIVPGNGLIVIPSLAWNEGGFFAPPRIMEDVNRSIQIKDLIKTHCVRKAGMVNSSVSASVEILRRQYLGLKRTIERVDPVRSEYDDCSAYIFTEYIAGEIAAKFHVERCMNNNNEDNLTHAYIFINRLRKPRNCWDKFCRLFREDQARGFHSTYFFTTLKGDDWSTRINQSFSFSFQKIINAPKVHGDQYLYRTNEPGVEHFDAFG